MSKENMVNGGVGRKLLSLTQWIKKSLLSIAIFRWVARFILVLAVLSIAYWSLVASDRYVSEANVIIQRTDLANAPSLDISTLVTGVGSANHPDQMLLREYLLSVDMLEKLDATLDLRSHYSEWQRDPISRMWFKNCSIEWFHRHYLSRVSVEFDDYAGVLRIKAQAYDPKMAQKIASMLVAEGERYMNQMGHELAQAQVDFATIQLSSAQERLTQANRAVLDFQNRKGLVSPQATAESINAIIGKLEEQRTEIQTQLASLPSSLVPNHPNIVMFKQSLDAVEKQIAQERAKLASPSGKTLNYTVEEFQVLQMQANFAQDVYKTAITALEKGRMDASRTLKKVSVLQAPTLPQYPKEPGRLYNTVVTLLFAAMLIGIVKLLESIVLDHVD